MKITSSIILSFLLLVFLLPAGAQPQQQKDFVCPPVRRYAEQDLVFRPGERLTIVANYRWGLINADVGEATMTIDEGRFRDTHYFVVRAYATTYKFWDNFFLVRDVYEGQFDTESLRPLYFHRNINEGGYKIFGTVHFNDKDYTIKSSTKRNDDPPKDTLLQGRSCTYDLISLFYNSRNLDFSNLSPGKIYPFSLTVDDEIYNLGYRFIGYEVKKISGLGTFRTLHFAAQLVAGDVFTGENELDIWITDDPNRVPLLIQSAVKVGRVSARLSKYANLKYPLTSKIK